MPNSTPRTDRERVAGRKRLVFWLILLGLVIAAILFLRCRGSLGLGGSGEDSSREQKPTGQPARLADTPSPADAALPRCQLRLDATGLTIAGKPGEIADAIAACEPPRAADLIVTGDANFGTAQQLETALKGAGIEVYRN